MAAAPQDAADTPAEEPQADAVADELEDDEDEEEPAPREKPAVPGAHLEVDIVPEGVDPLGRGDSYQDSYAVDPYALDEDVDEASSDEDEQDTTLAEPISTAAIDLGVGGPLQRDRQAQVRDRTRHAAAGHRQLSRQRAHARGALPAL